MTYEALASGGGFWGHRKICFKSYALSSQAGNRRHRISKTQKRRA